MRNYHIILFILIAMLLISGKTHGQDNGSKQLNRRRWLRREAALLLPPRGSATNYKCTRVSNTVVFDSSIVNNYGHLFRDMNFQKSVGINNKYNLFLLNLSSRKLSKFNYTYDLKASKNILYINYVTTSYKIEVDKLNLVKLNYSNDSLLVTNNSSKEELVDLGLTFSEYDFINKKFNRFVGKRKVLHHKSAMLIVPLSIISVKTCEAFFPPSPNSPDDSMARSRYASVKVADNYLLCLTYRKISIVNGGSRTSLLANKNSKSNLISENKVKYMRS